MGQLIMQSTTSQFQQLQSGGVRPHSYRLGISFDKQFDPSIEFFTLDTSLLDGDDILAPDGGNVITEWQKYDYDDYTDRVVGLEWTQETSLLTSVTTSLADIELNNYDRLFTRGAGSPLDSFLIPRRPLRIQSGFGNQLLPQFVGVSDTAPKAERSRGTASFGVQDFLRFIFDRKLDQVVMLIDKRVDEILEVLFDMVGVLPSQMMLDQARTTVPFCYFEKDVTLGYAVEQLMKAEMGSLYMDEQGFIVFKNRLRDSGSSVMTLTEENILDYSVSDETQIINSVRVKSEVRVVQPLQPVFKMAETIFLLPGQTVTKFFDFEDPVTSVEPIIAYIANSAEDGTGSNLYTDVSINTETLFGTSMLVEIQNTGSSAMYLTELVVDGTPAKVVKVVNVVEKDATSIAEFEEQSYEVESPYIQDEDTARSIALTIVRHFKDYGNTLEVDIKTNPALQIGDIVTVDADNIYDLFRIIKIVHVMNGSSARQTLVIQKHEIPDYFILSSDSEARSLLDGEDVLAA